uniref:IF rod domain-containing protein n=1 Tax=Caenorhabditis tropicalis TaxID=1561998 RepID=A0A1I7U7J9_9PELO
MPTVNALTKQFELSSHQEKVVPLRPRKNSNTGNVNGSAKSRSRVVVIDKSEKNSNYSSNRSGVVYSPGGILTTTIVDIEPARYGRRTEEYKIEEEYIVKRYDTGSPKYQRGKEYQEQETKEYRAYQGNHQDKYDERVREMTQRSYSSAAENHGDSPVDTSPIDVVKNVIGRWETKIGGVTTTRSQTADPQNRSVSRVDMNDNISRSTQEKIIVHQVSEPVERVIPISPLPPPVNATRTIQSQGLVQTYEEYKTVVLKQEPARAPTPEVAPIETALSPLPIPTPSPTIDIAEELLRTDEILTTQHTVAEHSTVTEETNQKEENVTDNELVVEAEKNVVIERNVKDNEEGKPQRPSLKEAVEDNKKQDTLHSFLDRDYRIKTYEEWSTTRRMRDRSQPPERPLTSYSSYSDRSKSIDRTYERRVLGSAMSRTYSEGRGLASGAFASGFGGGLVSGMSSAGAICTTQIRDAREREKREIGLLNDRLADYIEKVRFLEAQNQCLSHDIDILRRGFSGDGHISGLFNAEIAQAKRILEQTIAGRATFDRDLAALSSDVETIRKKWLESVSAVKAHREDHDVDLDKLSKIEAEISLFKRKIRIVEEDVIRIRRENDGIYNEIARIRHLIHDEIALKNERSLNVQDLLQRIKLLQTENNTRIEQELVFIRRDTTAENRDYFRQELQAAIRDIRADYEAISIRNRNDIEVWYREQIRKIQSEATRVTPDLYKEELASIRSTVTSVKSRLAEVEGRNFFLEKLIEDLRNNEENKLYEISLAEKDAQIAKLRDQCTELSIQMEKLCDHETSLRAEIERYRVLLNGANVTTYVSNTHPATGISVGGNVGTTRIISETTRTHSSSNTSYSGVPSRSGYTVGGNIGGVSVGGTIGTTSGVTAHASRGAAGSGTYQQSSYSYSSSTH